MKVRAGFVSNSSSCSFICDVCGNEQSGWDMSYEEAGMYECINGHIFCESHALRKYDREKGDRYYGSVESSICPVCNLHTVDNDMVMKYLLKEQTTTYQDVEHKIKTRFKSYDDFMIWVKDAS